MWIEITYLLQTSTSQPFNCGDGIVFHPSLFCACDYTSMFVLKLIHASKNVLGVVARIVIKKYVNILVFYFRYWLCINWCLSYTTGTVSSAGNKKNHLYIYIYIYSVYFLKIIQRVTGLGTFSPMWNISTRTVMRKFGKCIQQNYALYCILGIM